MKIKIIKPAEWYKNQVGNEFDVDVVTRYIGTHYEVKDFQEVYKKLHGKYPIDNEEGHLIALSIHLKDCEILDATSEDMYMIKNARPDQLERFFKR